MDQENTDSGVEHYYYLTLMDNYRQGILPILSGGGD